MASLKTPVPEKAPSYSERPAIWKIKRAFTVKFSRVLDGPVNIYKILGTDAAGLERHLTKNLKKGMTWDNYGKVWEVRPVLPMKGAAGLACSNFKPTFKHGHAN